MSVKEAKDWTARQLIKSSASTFDLEENSRDTIGEEKTEMLMEVWWVETGTHEKGVKMRDRERETHTHGSQSATHISKRDSGWHSPLSSLKARMPVAQGQVLAMFKPLIIQTSEAFLRMVLTVPICLPLQTLYVWFLLWTRGCLEGFRKILSSKALSGEAYRPCAVP